MDEYAIYTAMEYVIFGSYLVFILLSIQILFLWKNMDNDRRKSKLDLNNAIFKKSFVYMSVFALLFFIHEYLEGTGMQNIMLSFEMLEMLGFIILVLFAYGWYCVLKKIRS